MVLLEVRGLTRAPWWTGVELDVDAGEIAVLRGRSGSGKTLLLRALADLDPVDAGEVYLGGRARPEFAPHEWRRGVLYVHQTAPVLPGTVADNLAVIAELVDARPDPVPGLDPTADATTLSGGEVQRLALHRALCCNPRVLLLDEVTGALDPDAAADAEERIQAFARDGGAALWVSHDASLAERLGAREVPFP